MKSRNSKIIVLLLLIGLFLTGCGKKKKAILKSQVMIIRIKLMSKI